MLHSHLVLRSKTIFYYYELSSSKMINKEYKKRADTNMKCAANCLVDLTKERCLENVEVTDSGAVICSVAVTVYGTWQKRGLVFVIAIETGEVLDYELRCLYCHECVVEKNKTQSAEEYEKWRSEHESQCSLDH